MIQHNMEGKKKMKSWMKKSTALVAAIALGLVSMGDVSACTGIYAGSEVTEDGATYFGRSEDFGPNYTKVFEVTPAATHAKGEMLTDVDNFSIEYPSVTYSYTIVRDLQEAWAEYGFVKEPYAEAGMNEYGVSMSATVSTYDNSKVEAVDPLLYGEGGLTEMSLGTIILQSSKTAREAVETVAAIVDEYGAGECNAFFIADAKEVWFMEIVSGHQYVAVRLSDDKVAIVPNMMMLDQININDENVFASKDLVNLPKKHGFLVSDSDEEGSIHISKTYGNGYADYNAIRYYQGMMFLNPKMAATLDLEFKEVREDQPNAEELTAGGPFVLQYDPAQKVNIKTLMNTLSTRGEGTAHDADVDPSLRVIGTPRQAEVHLFQIRDELPTEINTVEWMAMGPSEFSLYLPYYGALLDKTPDVYATSSVEFDEKAIFWVFDELAVLCAANRKTVAPVVKAYFSEVQDSIIAQQKVVDEAMQNNYYSDYLGIDEMAHELSDSIANQAYSIALSVLKEVQAYVEAGATGEFTLKTNKLPVYKLEALDSINTKGMTVSSIEPSTLEKSKPLTYETYTTKFEELGAIDGFAYRVTGYKGRKVSFTRELPEGDFSSYKLLQIAGTSVTELPIRVYEDGTYTFNAKNLHTETCFVLVGTK